MRRRGGLVHRDQYVADGIWQLSFSAKSNAKYPPANHYRRTGTLVENGSTQHGYVMAVNNTYKLVARYSPINVNFFFCLFFFSFFGVIKSSKSRFQQSGWLRIG